MLNTQRTPGRKLTSFTQLTSTLTFKQHVTGIIDED